MLVFFFKKKKGTICIIRMSYIHVVYKCEDTRVGCGSRGAHGCGTRGSVRLVEQGEAVFLRDSRAYNRASGSKIVLSKRKGEGLRVTQSGGNKRGKQREPDRERLWAETPSKQTKKKKTDQ